MPRRPAFGVAASISHVGRNKKHLVSKAQWRCRLFKYNPVKATAHVFRFTPVRKFTIGSPSSSTTKRRSWTSGCSRSPLRCARSEEHTSELQSRVDLVCRLLLDKKKDPESPVLNSEH